MAANFVPVALNADRLPDTADGRFFRQLMTRWPQGLWVVTPDGQTIGFHYHQPKSGDNYRRNQQRWTDDTVAMLETAVQAAGPLPPRAVRAANPFPDRGVGLTSGGGARLAVSVIGLSHGRQEGSPAVDSVLLTKDECAAFAPPAGQAEWAIPEAAAKKFAPALSPVTDSIYVPRPSEVTKATITGRVVRETADGLMVIRYVGSWRSAHLRDNDPKVPIRADATGDGVGVYDPKTKTVRSVLWVLKGTYQGGPKAAPVPTAGVVEWVVEPDE